MTAESFLSKQLQKFTLVDLSLVKSVYFVFGLLIFTLYSRLSFLDWWFYGVMFVLCWLPLAVHFFSQEGSVLEKAHAFLKTNNPSNQVLIFLSTFFFSFMLCVLIPVLASVAWWVYVIIMAVLAIKPLTKTWCW
ncbi:MAG: hypothetical protein K0U24_06120 [Gammaproteobacteria bacterium]|nr:hypothetical protein [Gammaproteobacteria bacterium]MCH9763780.1 hypothetical protein [Gammaproteobacteria bacterium]